MAIVTLISIIYIDQANRFSDVSDIFVSLKRVSTSSSMFCAFYTWNSAHSSNEHSFRLEIMSHPDNAHNVRIQSKFIDSTFLHRVVCKITFYSIYRAQCNWTSISYVNCWFRVKHIADLYTLNMLLLQTTSCVGLNKYKLQIEESEEEDCGFTRMNIQLGKIVLTYWNVHWIKKCETADFSLYRHPATKHE